MEQDPMVFPAQRPPTPHAVSSACLLSVEKLYPKNKFNQKSEKMQKQRKTVQQD